MPLYYNDLMSSRIESNSSSPSSFSTFGFVFSLLFAFNLLHATNGDPWEYKLIHTILKGYDPSIRPSVHHNITLNVTFGLALAQLIDVVNGMPNFLLL